MSGLTCLCRDAPPRFAATRVHDAGPSRRDPTGTEDIRARFRGDLDKRWAKLRALTLEAFTAGIIGPATAASVHSSMQMARHYGVGGDPVRDFQAWFDEALRQVVAGDGSWLRRYVEDAIGRARVRASKLVTDAFNPDEPRDPAGKWMSGGGGGGSQTETEAFKKWFGNSKVVDENGKPLVVYHGTTAPEHFEAFSVGEAQNKEEDKYLRTGSGQDPRTFLGSHFAKEPEVANKFAKGIYGERVGTSEGNRVLPVFLKIEKPFITSDTEMFDTMMRGNYSHQDVEMELENRGDLDEMGEKYDSDEEFRAEVNEAAVNAGAQQDEPDFSLAEEMASKYRDELKAKGFDGIKYKNEIEGGTSFIAFDPTQIKSATGNKGTFNPKSPRIIDALPIDRTQTLTSLTHAELQGVCEAVSQQAVRCVVHRLLANQRAPAVARGVSDVISAVGKVRSRQMADYMVVKAFNGATLDAYRAAGIGKVGVVPERLRIKRGAHGKTLARDASRSNEFPTSEEYEDIIEAEAKLQVLGEVEVLTAGDDRVCEACQDISDNGPYDIDEAEGLIPQHIGCRCAFVPTDDARFADPERLNE